MNKKVIIGGIIVVLAIIIIIAVCFNNSNEQENERGVLRVGMECAYAPYNWSQTDNSNGAVMIKDSNNYAYGYDVMMAKKIAEELNLDLEIYQIDWDSLPVALQSNRIDCVIAGQSITSERLETVDFSTPYYYASIVALTNSDSEYANVTGISGLEGAKTTLIIALVGTVIGCIIGFVVGVIQTIPINKKDSIFKKIFVKILKIILNIYKVYKINIKTSLILKCTKILIVVILNEGAI